MHNNNTLGDLLASVDKEKRQELLSRVDTMQEAGVSVDAIKSIVGDIIEDNIPPVIGE
ncbi:MAG: hypothetical protein PHN31_02540 [Candidatus Gracilibacteria bacterium]|nr:hypothetical protein [Candidatus Gracilibacteria bacterium]